MWVERGAQLCNQAQASLAHQHFSKWREDADDGREGKKPRRERGLFRSRRGTGMHARLKKEKRFARTSSNCGRSGGWTRRFVSANGERWFMEIVCRHFFNSKSTFDFLVIIRLISTYFPVFWIFYLFYIFYCEETRVCYVLLNFSRKMWGIREINKLSIDRSYIMYSGKLFIPGNQKPLSNEWVYNHFSINL